MQYSSKASWPAFRASAPTFSQLTSREKPSNPRNSLPELKSALSLPKSNVTGQVLLQGLSTCPANDKDNPNLLCPIGVDHDDHLLNYILHANDTGKEYIGFSVSKVQCLITPPWVGVAVLMFIQATYSDKWRVHGSFLAGMLWFSLLDLERRDILSIPHRGTLRLSQLLLLVSELLFCVVVMT